MRAHHRAAPHRTPSRSAAGGLREVTLLASTISGSPPNACKPNRLFMFRAKSCFVAGGAWAQDDRAAIFEKCSILTRFSRHAHMRISQLRSFLVEPIC